MAIAQSIVEQVEEVARSQGLAKISTIRLRIGALRAVVPEALEFGFEVLSQDTPLAGARIVIEEIPIRITCHECGAISSPEPGLAWLCPACGSAVVEMTSGKELQLDSLEVED
ncbi:hydrogenase maturation nickel metallochaperone HypA [Candidatus Sumerlaeota bacterium]|nr:hydrogenase maturation nickel metallochaperone HypA [Candidatus Sumerlaeota bacterium]